MSDLTKRLRDIPLNLRTAVPIHYSAAFTKHEQAPTVNALDAGIVAHESADRIDALEGCLRGIMVEWDGYGIADSSLTRAIDKARALLESQ